MAPVRLLLAFVVSLFVSTPAIASQERAAPACEEWKACRAQTEEALAAGDYERAHDLAWRTVQRGPTGDTDLMFLLARAQCLSGRPHDALVMVRRIAEQGGTSDAATHPDLDRTRRLPEWPRVADLITRVADGTPAVPAPLSESLPAPSPVPAAGSPRRRVPAVPSPAEGKPAAPPAAIVKPGVAKPAVPAPAALRTERTGVEEMARVLVDGFVGAGLAYDAVSSRLVLGDRHNRKLRIVGEGRTHAVDLVGAESAGFFDVRALGIDTRRGDLWVATAEEGGGAARLHRVQLVSGRPLHAVELGSTEAPVSPVDLTVTAGGTVVALDQDGAVLRLRPNTSQPEAVVRVKAEQVSSVAAGRTEAVVYVAHRAGLARVDLAARTVHDVTAPAAVSLAGFERLRACRDGLVGLQVEPDGTRRIVQLLLNGTGRGVRQAVVFDLRLDAAEGPVGFTVSGDDVSLVTSGPDPAAAGTTDGIGPPPAQLLVRRVRIP